jgi:serine phosphatase RsbU (regulator of sigma subunit)
VAPFRRILRHFGSPFLRSVSLSSYALFLGAVFCLFSALGFINDIEAVGRRSVNDLAVTVLLTGVVAVAWVVALTRHLGFLIAAVPLFVISVARGEADPRLPEPDGNLLFAIERRLEVDAAGITLGVVGGYVCFVLFVAREGKRYLRVEAEIALAQEIHRIVAPPIERRIGRFEFHGASEASNEVGGDLVDVVDGADGWFAYVADVSGHGVASGTLMAMFKSAARSQLMVRMDAAALLTDLNTVIEGVKRPGMFITCACLGETRDGLQFSLAGHLPILHYRQATRLVEELSIGHLPIGMFGGQTYQTAPVTCDSGDLLVLLTDGLTEVFDRGDHEFGLERIKTLVGQNADRPLPELFQTLLTAARKHGPQTDDQSLLLVRVD